MSKRFFDTGASVILLLLLLPLIFLFAILVKMTSRGPIIFRQARVGLNGAPFIILKFRTLREGSGRPVDVVIEGDRRVTKIGKFLRSTRLDELPQLINVLKGEMSLVGPRPCLAYEIGLWGKNFPNINDRHIVRPGITGPAQIRKHKTLLTHWEIDKAISFDLAYVKEHSLLGDMYIIIKTVPHVFKRTGI